MLRRFSITARVTLLNSTQSFVLMAVYGPTRHREKEAFLQRIRRLKPDDDEPWLLIGDFNMIYRASDKNNININIRRMRCF